MNDTKAKIRAFLERSLGKGEIPDDDNFFERGYVNSLFAMQLVMFVEQEFGITVENDDLDINNFNTINAITQLVERKMAGTMPS